jgi:hypothetical protein
VLTSWKHPFRKSKRGSRRVGLEMPVRFRLPEQSEWSEGFTVNISSGGILFRADLALKVHSSIQLKYLLPDIITQRPGVPVDCSGEILRTHTPKKGDRTPVFAVKILAYDPATEHKTAA